jgi:ISXO2-like transposase domain
MGSPIVACLRQQPHTQQELAVFAAHHIATSATVVPDRLCCFRAATIVGAEHERIVTGGGKASVKLPQIKAINTLLGNPKTAITGTYHAFAFAKYAHRYLAQFQSRFNRRFNMKIILPRLLAALVAAPPSPERWLRAAELARFP